MTSQRVSIPGTVALGQEEIAELCRQANPQKPGVQKRIYQFPNVCDLELSSRQSSFCPEFDSRHPHWATHN